MTMKTGLTGSLVACVAAAGIAVGALALEPGGGPAQAPASAPAPPGAQAQTPAPAAGPAEQPSGGSPYGQAGEAAPAPPAGATVEISDFTFSAPSTGPGSTVTVANRDGFPHTVSADDGSFESGTVDAGATGTFVAPATPGTYQFHCEIHPQMSGTLTVG
jgi:plastocyanin